MSTAAEIADFVRLTRGLSSHTLAKAIRRLWPKADERDIREALWSVAQSDQRVDSTAM